MTTFSSKRSKLIAKLVRPLISAGLIFGGLFQMVAPVLAAGTQAGTNIENRASATYTDPATNNTLNAESNAVTATVAEVAALTNVAAGIVDVNGGSINSNDVLYFDFLVTNTGNAPTDINIPLASIIQDTNLSATPFPQKEYPSEIL